MYATKSHEQFIRDFESRRKDAEEYEILSEYLTATAPIEIRHKICGKPFESTPSRLTAKRYPERCPFCYKSNKRKTFDDIKKEIDDIGNGEFELLKDDFVVHIHNLTIKHKVCGKEFKSARHNIQKIGLKCPKCNERKGRPMRSQQEVEEEVFMNSNGRYELLSEYKGFSGEVRVRDNEKEKDITLSYGGLNKRINAMGFKEPVGKSGGKRVKKTEDARKEVKEKSGGQYELISDYLSYKDLVEVQNNKLGKPETMTYANLMVRIRNLNKKKNDKK